MVKFYEFKTIKNRQNRLKSRNTLFKDSDTRIIEILQCTRIL